MFPSPLQLHIVLIINENTFLNVCESHAVVHTFLKRQPVKRSLVAWLWVSQTLKIYQSFISYKMSCLHVKIAFTFPSPPPPGQAMLTGRRPMKPWQKWSCHAPLSKYGWIVCIGLSHNLNSYFLKKSSNETVCILFLFHILETSSVGSGSCLTQIKMGNISWLTYKKQLSFCQRGQMIWDVIFGLLDGHGSVWCGNLATCRYGALCANMMCK